MAVQSIDDRRAARLARPRHRRRLAATLRRFVAEAHDPMTIVLSPSPPLARDAIRASRGRLLALADRLADGRPAAARGLAMAHELVTSADSPLYQRAPGDLLARFAYETLCALDGR